MSMAHNRNYILAAILDAILNN